MNAIIGSKNKPLKSFLNAALFKAAENRNSEKTCLNKTKFVALLEWWTHSFRVGCRHDVDVPFVCRLTQLSEFAPQMFTLIPSSSLSHDGVLSIRRVETEECYAKASETASPWAQGEELLVPAVVGRFCFSRSSPATRDDPTVVSLSQFLRIKLLKCNKSGN